MFCGFATCAGCNTRQPNYGHDLCEICFTAWSKGPKNCAKCGTARPNPGYDLCEGCYVAWKASFPSPCCSSCEVNHPNAGRDLCQECFTKWVSESRLSCSRCKGKPNKGRNLCEKCYRHWVNFNETRYLRKTTIELTSEMCDDTLDTTGLWKPVDVSKLTNDKCPVCLDEFSLPTQPMDADSKPLLSAAAAPPPLDETDQVVVQLSNCTHKFHQDCIIPVVRGRCVQCPVCLSCNGVMTGLQPPGTMDIIHVNASLPGYPGTDTIVVTYIIPDGMQIPGHPSPGLPFSGTEREAYFPATAEGARVVELLKIAFTRRLIFSVGTSATTGQSDCVIWNSIHHKTQPAGGAEQHGYPDPTYLSRVTEELAAVGVTIKELNIPATPPTVTTTPSAPCPPPTAPPPDLL